MCKLRICFIFRYDNCRCYSGQIPVCVDSTTQAATDVRDSHTINERYSNRVNHLTTEHQSAFNKWEGSTIDDSVRIGGEVGLSNEQYKETSTNLCAS